MVKHSMEAFRSEVPHIAGLKIDRNSFSQWSFGEFSASPSFDSQIEVATIHTLGPASTSSHITAVAVQSHLFPNVGIVLHDTFESIFRWEQSGECRIVLVPSAYAGANAFFMNASMRLIGCFCHDTPPYHLAWSAEKAEPSAVAPKPLRVATHPAPIGLLPQLLPPDTEYTLVLCQSTVAAALLMLTGEADFALCNQRTIERLKLNARSANVVINMTWNLFLQSAP